MCKKLLVAVVAIVAGVMVVNHTRFGSLLQVWWKDVKGSVEKQIPPEVMVKQLGVEIDKIDREIKKNLSRLAQQEVEVTMLEEKVVALRETRKQLREDVSALKSLLDSKTEKVAYQGVTYRTSELIRKLDSAVNMLTNRTAEFKAKEQLLADKKQTLEAAHQRVSAMRDHKEQLLVTKARLETRLENLRIKMMADKVDLDESQVGKANELASQIDARLRHDEAQAKLEAQYGYRNTTQDNAEPKSAEEVLKAAKRALQDDGDNVASKK